MTREEQLAVIKATDDAYYNQDNPVMTDPEMQAYCTACGHTYPVDFDNENKVQITGPCFEDEEEE